MTPNKIYIEPIWLCRSAAERKIRNLPTQRSAGAQRSAKKNMNLGPEAEFPSSKILSAMPSRFGDCNIAAVECCRFYSLSFYGMVPTRLSSEIVCWCNAMLLKQVCRPCQVELRRYAVRITNMLAEAI